MNTKATKGLGTASPLSRVTKAPKAPTATPSVSSAKLGGDADYEAHSNHSTLMEAEHIKADPEKMAKVRQVAGRKLAAATAINKIADIKQASKNLRAGKAPMAGLKTSSGKKFPSGEIDADAEGHHATLERAEMIKSSPSKMAGVRKVAAAKMHAAKSVAELAGQDHDADDAKK